MSRVVQDIYVSNFENHVSKGIYTLIFTIYNYIAERAVKSNCHRTSSSKQVVLP